MARVDVRSERALRIVCVSLAGLCALMWIILMLRRWPQYGHDFPAFYVTGLVPLDSLYDPEVFQKHASELLEPRGVSYHERCPPYVRPAVFAWSARALAFFDFDVARAIWAGVQLALYGLAVFLLLRRFPVPPWWWIGIGLFFPPMFGIASGQDPITVLILLVLGFLLLERGRDVGAGLVFALCLYKFNLVLLLPVCLLVQSRYRALVWMAIGGVGLAGASALLVSPGQYASLLSSFTEPGQWNQPDRVMLGFRAAAYSLGAPALYYPLAALGVGAAIVSMRRLPLPEAFALQVIASLLVALNSCWYDGALLLFPVLVAISRGLRGSRAPAALLVFVAPLWFGPKLVVCGVITWLGGAFACRSSG